MTSMAAAPPAERTAAFRGPSSAPPSSGRAMLVQQNRPSREDEEEECFQDAVAVSSALVGENVLDSPRQQQYSRRLVSSVATSTTPHSSIPIPMLHEEGVETTLPDTSSSSLPSSRRVSTTSSTASSANPDDALSVGIMAQGLAWVERQRNHRRRLYLQNQAEQQLEKIRQAQREESSTAVHRSLTDNPTFQSLAKALQSMTTTAADETTASSSHDGFTESNSEDQEVSLVDGAVVSQSGDGYSITLPVAPTREEEDAAFIPPVRIQEEDVDLQQNPLILSRSEMQQIASRVLPCGIVYCKWKRLYSLARDGDSFEQCLRCIQNTSRTLMVVRTCKNAVFGAYADSTWCESTAQASLHHQPNHSSSYFGGPETCLFKFTDGRIRVFKWTGANRYIQLLDVHHKMLAFGGGGSDGNFGLAVEQDFQVGSTGHCATFDNEPLCDQENFEIADLEIFGFLTGQF